MADTQQEVESAAREVGKMIAEQLPEDVGFILITFGYNSGWVSYLSNGQRADVARALREMAQRLESGL